MIPGSLPAPILKQSGNAGKEGVMIEKGKRVASGMGDIYIVRKDFNNGYVSVTPIKPVYRQGEGRLPGGKGQPGMRIIQPGKSSRKRTLRVATFREI
jgi:hypothetical protein